MSAIMLLLGLVAVFGPYVFLAAKHLRKEIGIAELGVIIAPPLLLHLKAIHDVYMAIATNQSKYDFADMGLAMVTLFNLVWLPAMGVCFSQGRKRRSIAS